ncbi:general transcription factor IIF subunit 1 [Cuculus canorus]|uniref:general transcription factor IIF subunit 1 n=1 Tax=Cuculus canorus TaxID=55661 RepID=UPI0023AA9A40|nr:general transcription factor IIF subunit 1 [Cuculus canorus]XP_053907782.1 general transcription factor IIF subunit 1 [Cuculus canorus]
MASLGSGSGQTVTEYVVRVPKTSSKRYNIVAFNAADRISFGSWHQARMERDLSNKKIYQEEEMPESGAGSEYNRRLREEARRKKYGIVLREFRAEDQPWLLRVNGKAGRKFKGVKKGGVTENASYYVFTQCPDGAFEAFPVQNWYNFTPVAKHRTLTAEEAEEEWERRNKVLNHFSIMQQRRLRDQDEEEEEKEKGKKAKKKGGDLKIHDLEDDLELSSEESEGSEAEAEKPPRPKPPGGKKRKKAKGSDDEAFEDSDDGDFEGQEVDYMSDASSSSVEEEAGKAPAAKEDDAPKGIDEASESSEESEEEKAPEEKEEEEEEKKAPTPQEKKRKKDSSDESQTSEESDIDSETSSALFMAKKKTPPKRERRGSASSSRGESRPGTPEPGSTGSTLRAAASSLEQGRRQPPEPPAAKRLKLEPQPPSGKSTPSSGEVQLTEDAVRRYLTRKPMTTKDLLKKFQTKRTGLSSDATVNALAQLLKRLNPERKVIGDKMHFFLKE